MSFKKLPLHPATSPDVSAVAEPSLARRVSDFATSGEPALSLLRGESGSSGRTRARVPTQRARSGERLSRLTTPDLRRPSGGRTVDADPALRPAHRRRAWSSRRVVGSAVQRHLQSTHAEPVILLAADLLVVLPLTVIAQPVLAPVALVLASLVWRFKGLYSRRIALSVLDDLPALGAGVLLASAPVTMLGLALGTLSAGSAIALALGMFAGVLLGRCVAYTTILRLRVRRRINYPTLMLGAGAVATALTRRIQAHPESGLRLVGRVGSASRRAGPLARLGDAEDLARVVKKRHITDVVVGYGGMSSADLIDVLRTCDRLDVEIFVVPRLFEMHSLRGGDDHIWGVPLVRVRRSAHRVFTWRVKRLLDITMAAVGLALLAPVMLVVALAVRIEVGRGVIFRQIRVGLDERPFEVLKFRSMRPLPPGAEDAWTVTSADDRIGRVGRFIRRYSFDELPQLFNVLRGDMSVVGPRPERPEFVEQFSTEVARYGDRHRVPVGLTGLAAVNGLRGDTSIEERSQFDNWYIENWSLWFDVKIIVRTMLTVVRGTGS